MRRTVIALTLIGSLVSQPSLLDTLWSFLSTVWSESSPDEGCGADPDGRCRPVPQLQHDEGCGADPDGCAKGS
jgi:hypothetical protein